MTKTAEEVREYNRKYYLEHKEKMLAQAKKWREANADRIIANKIYNREHRGIKTYNRDYYLKNREKILKYQREYRLLKALGGLQRTQYTN